MELGSGSFTTESGESSTSLHGLKFGQKIYFEDVGSSTSSGGNNNNNNNIIQVNNNPSGGSGSGVSSSSGTGRKVRGGGGGAGGMVQTGGGGQPPRCQVEGCKVDLSDAKAYYSRHKVCSMHSKSPVVIVAGLEQRFCQQCSRSAQHFSICF